MEIVTDESEESSICPSGRTDRTPGCQFCVARSNLLPVDGCYSIPVETVLATVSIRFDHQEKTQILRSGVIKFQDKSICDVVYIYE